jgi:hypothetical protein
VIADRRNGSSPGVCRFCIFIGNGKSGGGVLFRCLGPCDAQPAQSGIAGIPGSPGSSGINVDYCQLFENEVEDVEVQAGVVVFRECQFSRLKAEAMSTSVVYTGENEFGVQSPTLVISAFDTHACLLAPFGSATPKESQAVGTAVATATFTAPLFDAGYSRRVWILQFGWFWLWGAIPGEG